MPFQKGNTIWKKGWKAKKENDKSRLDILFNIAEDGGAQEYANKLDKLARGKALSESELEFMNRFEKLFEYLKPKLSRKDVDVTSGGSVIDFFGKSADKLKNE